MRSRTFLITLVTLGLLPACCWAEDTVEDRLRRLEKMVADQQATIDRQDRELSSRNQRIKRLESQFQEQKTRSALDERAYFSPLNKADGTGHDASGIQVTFSKGLRFKTNDGQHKVALGGRIMQDWRWQSFEDEMEDVASEDGTEMRRARIYMKGTYYKNVFWKWNFDFQDGGVETKDVYLGLKNLPGLGNFRVGAFQEPFSLADLTSSKYITFMERGLPVLAFTPGRNPGMMFNNQHLDKRLTWAAGIFKTAPDTAIMDDDGWNVTARVTGLPYFEDNGRRLVHLGLAGSWRNPNANNVRIRARPEVHWGNRFVDTGDFDHGFGEGGAEQELRLGLELAWVWGPASLQAEYIAMWVDRDDGLSDDVDRDLDGISDPTHPILDVPIDFQNTFFSGAYVFFSYWLTGEHRPYDQKSATFSRVSPRKNFWQDGVGLGAFEVALRASYLDITDNDVDGGRLFNMTAGVNWHWNPNTRIMFNYVHSDLDRSRDNADLHNQINGISNAFQMRFQIDF